MCQYGGSALLEQNQVILNYTEELLIFVTCRVSVNNLRLLAIRKQGAAEQQMLYVLDTTNKHSDWIKLHQTCIDSQQLLEDGDARIYLTMGYLCRMVFVVSYTNSQLSFLIVEVYETQNFKGYNLQCDLQGYDTVQAYGF